MNMLSLYSGIGGIDLAAHWAGMTTVAMCEQDAFCRSILNRHWPGVPIFESDEHVTRESIHDRIDIIAGGPPCQPFSVAGKRGGVDDPRHRWPQMARIVDELRPAFVVVENVAGFSDVAEQLVRTDLEGIGYVTRRYDIPAAGIGAPHKRERIFIVGLADSDRDRCNRSGVHLPEWRSQQAVPVSSRAGFGVADTDRTVRNESESVTECGDSSVAGNNRQAVDLTDERATSGVGDTKRTRREGLTVGHIRSEVATAGSREGRTESLVGGIADVISDRLDAARWPAPFGCEQYDYEPPRVTIKREHRRKRLKALGNAVVPLQIYPLLALIVGLSEIPF